MTTAGRLTRTLATLAGIVLLLAGTLKGSDDDFPFGPFRMYAGVNKPTAVVNSARLEAVREDGQVVRVRDRDTGLRRAELEGQLPRFERDPGLLGHIAAAQASRHPTAPHYVEVRIVQRRYEVVGGKPTGHYTDHVLARWRQP